MESREVLKRDVVGQAEIAKPTRHVNVLLDVIPDEPTGKLAVHVQMNTRIRVRPMKAGVLEAEVPIPSRLLDGQPKHRCSVD